MSAAMHRMLAPMLGRIQLMIGRAVIAAVDDAAQAQALQVELLEGEAHDGVERFAGYGFTSHPHAGAEALVAFVGGLRSHGVIVAVEDRRYRLKGLAAGEVAIFDDQGAKVHLTRDGIVISSEAKVRIEAPTVEVEADTVTITADSASIIADTVNLGGTGGAKVARIGDDVNLSTGKIISGSNKVKSA